ncbi:multidrug resistance protein fnx1 [Hypoxylon sp. FL0890]|nr:multidrug resistance protein fnx1 [Hypoxylon sp. FL0890]
MDSADARTDDEGFPKQYNKSFRFWAIIITLCFLSVLSALENTVVTTSLPYISSQLNLGESYVWVTNVFFLTAAIVQPLFGQLANIFGRRWVTMAVIVFFVLGSGICGGASNGAMLIAGRAIQGMGGGGLNTMPNVIVSDLVPLRDRGKYVAWYLTTYFVGTAIGPWVGGAIVETTSWRWVFYINLPVGGASMLMVFFSLHVQYNKEMSFIQKLHRIDYIGNILLIGSSISILYALSYGGSADSWSSWSIVTPLVVGIAGLGIFVYFETTPWAKEPVVPPHLFGNRTSAVVMIVTFISSALLYWVMFFMPVYFQAVLGSSASYAGVQVLPSLIVAVPVSIVSVLALSRFGRYKPIHLTGFTAITIGLGLMTLLNNHSTTAEWVVFQIINSIGNGTLLNSLLPACQASLTEPDQAATTAVWSSIRSFGSIWGVIIPAAIFNNRFEQLAWRIADPEARSLFLHGNAYSNANSDFLSRFTGVIHEQIVGVYSDALKQLWLISIAFGGVSFLLVLFEREIELRTALETEYGLKEESKEEKVVGRYQRL